jgi:hypothetical protein
LRTYTCLKEESLITKSFLMLILPRNFSTWFETDCYYLHLYNVIPLIKYTYNVSIKIHI